MFKFYSFYNPRGWYHFLAWRIDPAFRAPALRLPFLLPSTLRLREECPVHGGFGFPLLALGTAVAGLAFGFRLERALLEPAVIHI